MDLIKFNLIPMDFLFSYSTRTRSHSHLISSTIVRESEGKDLYL